MTFMRAARVDANQKEIVAAFRKTGWYVLITSQLKNCCDLVVSKNGRTIAVEIKDGKKPKSSQRLTEGELKFMEQWQGEYAFVTSLGCVGALNDGKELKYNDN